MSKKTHDPDLARANRNLAVLLAVIALVFFLGVIFRMSLFGR